MAKGSIIQDAWQAIVNRLRNDTDFNDFFSAMFMVKVTEQVQSPYFHIKPDAMEINSAATMGTNITNEIQAAYSGEIVSTQEDDEVAINELLLGAEIFINAFDDTDVTFDQKFQGDFVITFAEITEIEGQANTLSWPFAITGKIQPYNAGDL